MNDGKKVAGRRSSGLLILLIVSVVSFAAGMRSDAIFSVMGPLFGARVEAGRIDLSSVQETYRKLQSNYDGELDIQELIYGANKGLVAAAGDNYTAYLDPEDVSELERDISGNIGGGIGAEIGIRNGQPSIVRPLKGSPAEQAGVKAGDAILEVNGQDVTEMGVDQVVEKIRGEIDTKVKLSLLRGQEVKEFSITRKEVTSPAVEASIQGKTGILKVARFNSDTGSLARAEAEKFRQRGVNKVILDLRNNPGGEVTAARALAGLWLDNQVVLTQKRGETVVHTDKSTGRPILANTKTIVLINGASASASEIIAGSLKDYGKAKLVGEKTYGKGSVQAILPLSGGSELKVTEARWYTPKGKNIDKTGIAPDVSVKMTIDDINNNRDPQMDKAMSL